MAKVYARGKRLWHRVKIGGRWRSMATPFSVGDEVKAQLYADAAQAATNKREAAAVTTEPALTLAVYAARWIKLRRELGVRSWENERARLERHVLPRLGGMLLAEIRPMHVRDLVRELVKAGELAPRTIRDVYGVLRTLLENAVSDEIIEVNPCRLRRGRDLPKKRDADPEWRANATYTVREVEQLISDARIPVERRVLYALKAIGALRHEEAAALRWRCVDLTIEPLGRMTIAYAYDSRACEIKETKSGEVRLMPIHPTLGKLLAAWKLSHWARLYGHAPGPDDLVIPTRTGRCVNVSDAGHALTEDMTELGLRVLAGERRKRGGHDLRSWFITSAQECGAHRDILKVCTHGAGGDVMSGYTRVSWEARCAEVAKLRVSVLGGEVLELATGFATAELKSGNRWLKEGEPRRSRTVLTPPEVHEKPCDPENSADLADRSGSSGTDAVARLATDLAGAVLAGDQVTARRLALELAELGEPWRAQKRITRQ